MPTVNQVLELVAHEARKLGAKGEIRNTSYPRQRTEIQVHEVLDFDTFTVNTVREEVQVEETVVSTLLFINDVNVTPYIDIERRANNGWSRSAPKYQLKVGDYGNKSTFPEKGDGSFSYDKAAAVLVNMVNRFLAAQRAHKLEEQNRQCLPALRQRLGLNEYGSKVYMSGSRHTEGKLAVQIKLDLSLTEAEVERVVTALRDAGLTIQ